MKLTLKHQHVRSTDHLDSWVEKRVFSLVPKVNIEEAIVRLECRFEESPRFMVHVHLVTPGPDIVAETRDHTLRAAVDKAISLLENTAHHRKTKRVRKLKSNLQAPAELTRGRIKRVSSLTAH